MVLLHEDGHAERHQEKGRANTMTATPVPDEMIAAARAYEQLFVPALFTEWTAWVADAAQIAVAVWDSLDDMPAYGRRSGAHRADGRARRG